MHEPKNEPKLVPVEWERTQEDIADRAPQGALSPTILTRRSLLRYAGLGAVAFSQFPSLFSERNGLQPAGAHSLTLSGVTAKSVALQLPFWSDMAGWDQPPYYETMQAGRKRNNKTVQSADIDGDGRDELIIRGPQGILVNRFDPATSQWIQLPDGPQWSDDSGFNLDEFYSTIQTADIDGDGQAELLVRDSAGIQAWRYDADSASPTYKQWIQLARGPEWSYWAWNQPQYFSTIQCADIDGDGRAEVLARSADGMLALKYDKASNSWSELFSPANNPTWSDADGWDQPGYYSTIQCAHVVNVWLIGRAPDSDQNGGSGLQAYFWNGVNSLQEATNLDEFTDDQGWHAPQYYDTIQFADIDGDGQAELIARASGGIIVWKWNGSDFIQRTAPLSFFSDAGGWTKPEFYSTIQFADIDGDGAQELIARAGAGIFAFKFQGGSWAQMPVGPAWSDGNSWDEVQYYSTIQTARVLLPGDPGYTGDGTHKQAVLIGRGSGNVETWRYDTVALEWKTTTNPFPAFTDAQATAYDYITTALGVVNTSGAGIRAVYGDESANFQGWIADLLGNGANPVPPPANVPAADWEAVKTQIIRELGWAYSVNLWYGTLAPNQITDTFLAKSLSLYTVGPYLNYSDNDTTELTLSILALIGGAIAAALGFPELEAGAAAAVTGVIATAFSAAASNLPGGGGSGFQTQYNQLQNQLANGYNAAIQGNASNQTAITGYIGNNGFVPGDYGLFAAIGQMIGDTTWSWPDSTLELVTVMQRAYAIEVFKVLFVAYQKNANYDTMWFQSIDSDGGGWPSNLGYPAYALYNDGQYNHWLSTNSDYFTFPPSDTLKALFAPALEGQVFPLAVPTDEFFTNENGWPVLNTGDINVVAPPRTRPAPPSLKATIAVAVTLTRDVNTNKVSAKITLRNRGYTGATNVAIATGEVRQPGIGKRLPLGNLPSQRKRLRTGKSVVLTAPVPEIAAGRKITLRLSGRYKGGSFGGSFRLTMP